MQQSNTKEKNTLILIPKAERYIQYIIELIVKIPRVEKFSIGTEYKQSMYRMLEMILYVDKISDTEKLKYINRIDSELNVQRIFLRIMCKNMWIDKRKFDVAMEQIYEIGKIVGGLIKFYAKNNKKSI
ncbi:MAG: four helix bundle protein [Clostridia bacterium]|nr:four helix bundle protein [Clostridia bacterium]